MDFTPLLPILGLLADRLKKYRTTQFPIEPYGDVEPIPPEVFPHKEPEFRALPEDYQPIGNVYYPSVSEADAMIQKRRYEEYERDRQEYLRKKYDYSEPSKPPTVPQMANKMFQYGYGALAGEPRPAPASLTEHYAAKFGEMTPLALQTIATAVSGVPILKARPILAPILAGMAKPFVQRSLRPEVGYGEIAGETLRGLPQQVLYFAASKLPLPATYLAFAGMNKLQGKPWDVALAEAAGTTTMFSLMGGAMRGAGRAVKGAEERAIKGMPYSPEKIIDMWASQGVDNPNEIRIRRNFMMREYAKNPERAINIMKTALTVPGITGGEVTLPEQVVQERLRPPTTTFPTDLPSLGDLAQTGYGKVQQVAGAAARGTFGAIPGVPPIGGEPAEKPIGYDVDKRLKLYTPILSISKPINVKGKTSSGDWKVEYETPYEGSKTGKYTANRYFFKKTQAQAFIDYVKSQPPPPSVEPITTTEPTKPIDNIFAEGQLTDAADAELRAKIEAQKALNIPIGETQDLLGTNVPTVKQPPAVPISPPKDYNLNIVESGDIVKNFPTKLIQFDPQRFQFKQNVDEHGVQKPIQGNYWDKQAGGLVILWQDINGNTFVADGHHRLEYANRVGQPTVNAWIYKESDGYTPNDVKRISANTNIYAGTGTIYDHSDYFRYGEGKEYDEQIAKKRGMETQRGYIIGKFATDNTYSRYRTGEITPEQGEAISANASNNEEAQLFGVRIALEGKPPEVIKNTLKFMSGRSEIAGEQTEIGKSDTSWQANALAVGEAVTKHMTELRNELSSFKNLTMAKKAGIAEEKGVNVEDKGFLKSERERLETELNNWKNYEKRGLLPEAMKLAGIEPEAKKPAVPAPEVPTAAKELPAPPNASQARAEAARRGKPAELPPKVGVAAPTNASQARAETANAEVIKQNLNELAIPSASLHKGIINKVYEDRLVPQEAFIFNMQVKGKTYPFALWENPNEIQERWRIGLAVDGIPFRAGRTPQAVLHLFIDNFNKIGVLQEKAAQYSTSEEIPKNLIDMLDRQIERANITKEKIAQGKPVELPPKVEVAAPPEKEARELEQIAQNRFDEYWKKNPTQQMTGENNSQSTFLTSAEQSRLQELNAQIQRTSDKLRGIESQQDLKDIVQLKRKLNQSNIRYPQNASKSQLTDIWNKSQSLTAPTVPEPAKPAAEMPPVNMDIVAKTYQIPKGHKKLTGMDIIKANTSVGETSFLRNIKDNKNGTVTLTGANDFVDGVAITLGLKSVAGEPAPQVAPPQAKPEPAAAPEGFRHPSDVKKIGKEIVQDIFPKSEVPTGVIPKRLQTANPYIDVIKYSNKYQSFRINAKKITPEAAQKWIDTNKERYSVAPTIIPKAVPPTPEERRVTQAARTKKVREDTAKIADAVNKIRTGQKTGGVEPPTFPPDKTAQSEIDKGKPPTPTTQKIAFGFYKQLGRNLENVFRQDFMKMGYPELAKTFNQMSMKRDLVLAEINELQRDVDKVTGGKDLTEEQSPEFGKILAALGRGETPETKLPDWAIGAARAIADYDNQKGRFYNAFDRLRTYMSGKIDIFTPKQVAGMTKFFATLKGDPDPMARMIEYAQSEEGQELLSVKGYYTGERGKGEESLVNQSLDEMAKPEKYGGISLERSEEYARKGQPQPKVVKNPISYMVNHYKRLLSHLLLKPDGAEIHKRLNGIYRPYYAKVAKNALENYVFMPQPTADITPVIEQFGRTLTAAAIPFKVLWEKVAPTENIASLPNAPPSDWFNVSTGTRPSIEKFATKNNIPIELFSDFLNQLDQTNVSRMYRPERGQHADLPLIYRGAIKTLGLFGLTNFASSLYQPPLNFAERVSRSTIATTYAKSLYNALIKNGGKPWNEFKNEPWLANFDKGSYECLRQLVADGEKGQAFKFALREITNFHSYLYGGANKAVPRDIRGLWTMTTWSFGNINKGLVYAQNMTSGRGGRFNATRAMVWTLATAAAIGVAQDLIFARRRKADGERETVLETIERNLTDSEFFQRSLTWIPRTAVGLVRGKTPFYTYEETKLMGAMFIAGAKLAGMAAQEQILKQDVDPDKYNETLGTIATGLNLLGKAGIPLYKTFIAAVSAKLGLRWNPVGVAIEKVYPEYAGERQKRERYIEQTPYERYMNPLIAYVPPAPPEVPFTFTKKNPFAPPQKRNPFANNPFGRR